MDELNYDDAVEKIANLEKYANTSVKINSFDRSLILSVLFNKSKKQTLDDIIKLRK